uniref:Pentatricopeptide repeat-containing protein n=1 Tax=Tanacetum cinerariifolium TaxID=118510 RepID=A0A699J018_TANCI|nr:hypothetical protein [Tanacetum cinerariifolium]
MPNLENKFSDAEDLINEMKEYGCAPDNVTHSTLLNALCKKGCLSEASHVLELMKPNGILPDVWTYNPLNCGLCDEGKVKEVITGPTGRCLGYKPSSKKVHGTHMAAFLSNDQMHSGRHEGGTYKQSGSTVVESGDRRYFSRKEIEEKSPSRSDGIDLKKETYLCKSDWEMLVHGLFSLFRKADQKLYSETESTYPRDTVGSLPAANDSQQQHGDVSYGSC